jgi:N-acetylglutamate synthase-like GNAT family acetyltransferase
LNIRASVPSDADALERLLRQLHPDRPVMLRPDEVRQSARSFVATEADLVVGFALATFVDYGLSSYGMIEELVVDTSQRGRGVGTALLTACQEWLTEQRIEVVFVSALDDAAEAFYRRYGFVPCQGSWLYWVPTTEPARTPGAG